MSVISSPALFMGEDGYQISRSVRLRSSASAYFSRTNGVSPTSNKICTWSFWFKNSQQSSNAWIVGTGTAGTSTTEDDLVILSASQTLYCELGGTATGSFQTSQVFRDPSAWYHIVVAFDTTQATNTNRIKVYVNGVQVTSFASISYPSQNATLNFGGTQPQSIGRRQYGASNYFDGYITEVNFIDGQQLTPSSFGENDSITGVWKPKKYAGTYGTNGFYLNFSDNSNNTAATIGKDYSGNGNNWTPNNISVTTGSTYDSMLDTPTPYADGGNGRGNYAVLNPLSKTANATISDANLKVTFSGANGYDKAAAATMAMQSKTYWEVTDQTAAIATYGNAVFGIVSVTAALAQSFQSSANMISFRNYDGSFYRTGTTNPAGSGAPFGSGATNDVYMFAYDPATTSLWAGRNGTWFNSGNPASGTGAISTASIGDAVPFIAGYQSGDGPASINFGQRPFAYTPPTGFKALNTQNLPDSTIKAGNKYFDATTYTGTGASLSVTNTGSMQPDLIWLKSRNSVENHFLFDSVRGSSPNYSRLSSNLTDAEATPGVAMLTAINSNGFTLGTNGGVNTSTNTYVGWQWKAGNGSSSNTSGSITSTVSVNATAGFSIGTYDATGANGTVGHGLGVAPKMVIIKNRYAANSWVVWHTGIANTEVLLLNSTNGKTTDTTAWNSTSPTSTVISLGSGAAADTNQTNASSPDHVFYAWAEVAGFSKFGSYTGNGSADGPFVYCGFRPAFIMAKDASVTNSWVMYDLRRDPYNVSQNYLIPNSSGAEGVSTSLDITANGFKIRTTGPGALNTNGSTVIYAAFAENPFKNALAR